MTASDPQFVDFVGLLCITVFMFAAGIAVAVMWKLNKDLRKSRDLLHDELSELVRIVNDAVIEDGVCCCGSPMKGHEDPYNAGHTPLDTWDYFWKEKEASLNSVLEKTK